MSDNIPLPNSGEIAAADDIAGVKYQRIKLVQGDDGVNDGDVSKNNPLPTTNNDAALISMLRALVHPIWEEAATGRLRVVLDPAGGAQTLGTITTLSNMSSVGGVATNSMIYDNMHAAWATSVRRAVS
jgi:hypothetical protein